MQFFFPRKHRQFKLVYYLMAVELPFTIVILTLTGIASHDLFRTFLWKDGAENGFNSAPDEVLYAAANHREYQAPMVWSKFITNYNLVIGVLGTFLLIVKFPLHMMHLLFPPIAASIHGATFILYVVSASYQAGSDMSDPRKPQPGPPWYITKKCSVARHPSNIAYCQQAKALFAVTVVVIVLYFTMFCVSIHSCFIAKEERDEILEQREEKRIEKEFEEEVLNSPGMIPMTPGFLPQGSGMIPRTPGFPPMAHTASAHSGAISPFTPRTLAFNRLDSQASDLPLRNTSTTTTPQIMQQPSPDLQNTASAMYFPPPPKKASKN